MSNFNVQNKNWRDLVFENRNQSYGAYQLRKENNRTTIGAFIFSTFLLAGVVVLMSFTSNTKAVKPKPKVINKEETVVIINFQPKAREKEVVLGKTNTKKNKTTSNLAPVVSSNPEVKPLKPEDNATINNPLGSETGTSPGTEGKPEGKPTVLPVPSAPSGGSEGPEIPGNGIYKPGKEAQFPGGINKFRTFIAENFEVPENFDSEILNIVIYFVVEKDGTMTDYKMVKGDKSLEKEAIRVLKAMNKKWSPGMVNGFPVRSEYRVPIQINLVEQN